MVWKLTMSGNCLEEMLGGWEGRDISDWKCEIIISNKWHKKVQFKCKLYKKILIFIPMNVEMPHVTDWNSLRLLSPIQIQAK